jgi:hypothetical protein
MEQLQKSENQVTFLNDLYVRISKLAKDDPAVMVRSLVQPVSLTLMCLSGRGPCLEQEARGRRQGGTHAVDHLP